MDASGELITDCVHSDMFKGLAYFRFLRYSECLEAKFICLESTLEAVAAVKIQNFAKVNVLLRISKCIN